MFVSVHGAGPCLGLGLSPRFGGLAGERGRMFGCLKRVCLESLRFYLFCKIVDVNAFFAAYRSCE